MQELGHEFRTFQQEMEVIKYHLRTPVTTNQSIQVIRVIINLFLCFILQNLLPNRFNPNCRSFNNKHTTAENPAIHKSVVFINLYREDYIKVTKEK